MVRPLINTKNFIFDMFKLNRVSDEALKLRLFSFSLNDQIMISLDLRPPRTFTTWQALSQALSQAFLTKFFPSRKMTKIRNNITTSTLREYKTLYEALKRCKDL